MVKLQTVLAMAAGLVLSCLLACSGSSSNSGSGAMTVHLVDGPLAGYQEINVHILTVEISSGGGWVTLGSPNKTINLLSLVGGVEETLAHGATLPAGHYQQMRLLLGSGNTVKLADGTVQPLTVPSGLQTGVKLTVSFEVAAGTTKDVWIDFDAAHAIQVVETGASGKYILRPTVWAYDRVATGSISGVLTDLADASALVGAMVYAETLDGTGQPAISRGTLTDATGAYTLDLLPVGYAYHVVSQPLTGGILPKAYDAKASDAFHLTTATPVFTYHAAFTADASTGSLSGGITPLASLAQSDQVDLRQSLSTSGGPLDFIVRSTMAVVGSSAETYGFDTLPAGAYGAQAIRTTLNADGTATHVASPVQATTVTAGNPATADLGF